MNTSTDSKLPHYYAFTQANDKAPLIRIGAAWQHNKGDGINLKLDSIPLNGEIVLFTPKDSTDSE